MTNIHIAAVLTPDGPLSLDSLSILASGSIEGLHESLRDKYDQGGVYDEDGDIVADLINDGYLVTIEKVEV